MQEISGGHLETIIRSKSSDSPVLGQIYGCGIHSAGTVGELPVSGCFHVAGGAEIAAGAGADLSGGDTLSAAGCNEVEALRGTSLGLGGGLGRAALSR